MRTVSLQEVLNELSKRCGREVPHIEFLLFRVMDSLEEIKYEEGALFMKGHYDVVMADGEISYTEYTVGYEDINSDIDEFTTLGYVIDE